MHTPGRFCHAGLLKAKRMLSSRQVRSQSLRGSSYYGLNEEEVDATLRDNEQAMLWTKHTPVAMEMTSRIEGAGAGQGAPE